MRRREFLGVLGGAAATWPLATRAQQAAMPVVGLLRSTPAAPFANLVEALRRGLKEEGFEEGRNVAIKQRWADNQPDRLPELAADLVHHQAAVIVCNAVAAQAARAATATIPIVFVVGDDPVKMGLVTNMNRPNANLTGVTFFGGGVLGAKRLELLRDLVPKATVVSVLSDPNFAAFETEWPSIEAAGRALWRQIELVKAASEAELEPAFARMRQAGAGALLISGGPFFNTQRPALVALAARYAIPTIYDLREFVEAGGLMSYSASFPGARDPFIRPLRRPERAAGAES